MHSLDFEEYLWAKGYSNEQIEDLYQCMTKSETLSKIQIKILRVDRNIYFFYCKS